MAYYYSKCTDVLRMTPFHLEESSAAVHVAFKVPWGTRNNLVLSSEPPWANKEKFPINEKNTSPDKILTGPSKTLRFIQSEDG